jgi:hypothetical protein
MMTPFMCGEKICIVMATGLGAVLRAVGSISPRPGFWVLSGVFVGFPFMTVAAR